MARVSVLSLALAGVSFSASGCGGGGGHAPIHIELAPIVSCDAATNPYPADLRFFDVRVCATGTDDCVLLQDPNGDHGGGTTELRVPRALDTHFTLDARVDPSTDYDVRITAYSGPETGTCAPYALGHANEVRFGRDQVQVRLYPVGVWSCAGVHEGSSGPVPRALHQAVLLPNHDVLILGGVEPTMGLNPSAVNLSTNLMMPMAGAQRLVEVFDPRVARFHAVTMSDEEGRDGFARVMFEARYIRTNEMGQYEIHTYGGFDPDHVTGGGGGVVFDAQAQATAVSAFFGPLSPMMTGADAGFRSDTVILYDPVAHTATLTPHMVGNYATTAASEGSSTIAVVRGINTVTAASGRVSAYGLSAAWSVDGGAQGALLADRLGATVTPISPTSFLVWGGDVANMLGLPLTTTGMPTQVAAFAGEVINTTTMATTAVVAHDPAMPGDGRPVATAYHTATHIAGPAGPTSVLLVGGVQVNGGNSPLSHAPFASPTMTITRFGADGAIMGSSTVTTTRDATIFHTATAVDASATSVLVVGGANQMTVAGTATTFFGETQTGLVRYTSGTTYTWSELPTLVQGRWGHTTTIIPNHGVLVVGGLSRDAMNSLPILTSSEFLLWEDLTSSTPPASMNCAMSSDAGMPSDAHMSLDSGPAPVDANVHPDAGGAVDADVDSGRDGS